MSDFAQINYDQYTEDGYEGGIFDMSYTKTMSYSAQGPLRYGSAVSLTATGNKDRQVHRHNLENTIFRGIVIREHNREGELTPLVSPEGDGETSYVKDKQTASIATKGRVWVRVYEDVEAGDPVHVGILPGAEGAFSGSNASTLFTNDPLPNAMFIKGALAGELAVIELN